MAVDESLPSPRLVSHDTDGRKSPAAHEVTASTGELLNASRNGLLCGRAHAKP
jgi:hypothetical protein